MRRLLHLRINSVILVDHLFSVRDGIDRIEPTSPARCKWEETENVSKKFCRNEKER